MLFSKAIIANAGGWGIYLLAKEWIDMVPLLAEWAKPILQDGAFGVNMLVGAVTIYYMVRNKGKRK